MQVYAPKLSERHEYTINCYTYTSVYSPWAALVEESIAARRTVNSVTLTPDTHTPGLIKSTGTGNFKARKEESGSEENLKLHCNEDDSANEHLL